MFKPTFPIVLASNSPRRKHLLSEVGFDYEVRSKNVDEIYPEHLTREQIPLYLAELKATPLLAELGDAMLIAADTIVWLNGEVLGKPESRTHAMEIVGKLSGKTHEVITGVYMNYQGKIVRFYDITEVTFRTLSPQEIEEYIERYQPMDKAGSYGIQEWIGYAAVEKINGCYYNVMGLPIQKVYQAVVNWRR